MTDKLSKPQLIRKIDDLESKLKITEQKSSLRRDELEALKGGLRSVLESKSFQDTAQTLFERCKIIIGNASGYVALLSKSGNKNDVLFLDSGGLPCNVDPELPMPVRGLRAEAYGKNKAVFHNDFMNSRWVKYMPRGHVHLKNVLFAPLILDGKTVGIIGLANKPTDFNENDARIASCFGELAAISLMNSRNIESVIQNSMKVVESDRSNLSKELHDGISGTLGAVKLKLHMILQNKENLHGSVKEVIGYIDKLIKEIRRLSTCLSYSDPADFDLFPTLQWYCETLANCYDGIKFGQNFEITEIEIPQVYKNIIYRVFQEAAWNAIKHGEAEKITFSLAKENGKIVFFIEDDGKGFDASLITDTALNTTGHGLRNMRERVEIVSGVFEMWSRTGSGTRIRISLPILNIF